MKKEDIVAVAQLLSGMKDAVDRIEKAQKDKDGEQLALAKKELI